MLRTREESFGVLYADEPLSIVSREDLRVLETRVTLSPLKRTRLCTHGSPADQLHEMFIVQCPETYIRPHKHVGKAESMLVLSGRADVLFFREDGEIESLVSVGDYASGLPFFYRMAEGVYHGLIVRTSIFLFKEATVGPFDKMKTVFAAWAPAEEDRAAAAEYRTSLRARADALTDARA